jgi:ribosomal protein S18 acetylase RimI-like enzyme
MTMTHPLDCISWNSLTGLHAKFSVGNDVARRYAKGYSPIIGFANPEQPAFDQLAPHCDPGEHFYCENWAGEAPAGWSVSMRNIKFKMVWEDAMPAPDTAPQITRLGAEHASQAVELAKVASPGPFGPRALELGEYYGWFEGPQLVAMAGERLRADRYHEISSVCTHPDFQGRGLARRLTAKLIGQQMQRNEISFLQVMQDNVAARTLYERMGFRVYRQSIVCVIART